MLCVWFFIYLFFYIYIFFFCARGRFAVRRSQDAGLVQLKNPGAARDTCSETVVVRHLRLYTAAFLARHGVAELAFRVGVSSGVRFF